jgi:hypothetical protein
MVNAFDKILSWLKEKKSHSALKEVYRRIYGPDQARHKHDPHPKHNESKKGWGEAQVVLQLPSKYHILSSNPSRAPQKRGG